MRAFPVCALPRQSGGEPARAVDSPELGIKALNDVVDRRCVAIVVEDEWLVRMELADALSAAGLKVFEASAGEEALAHLEHPDPIHVLVTDIRLLGSMSGWDVADAFRAARPTIGVIYASANAPIEARQVAGSVFFAKPAPMKELVRTCHGFCPGGQSPGRAAS